MSERLNKTSICSIVFLDIVAYSQMPVSDQSDYKDRFNALINEALKDVAQNDRIILDTGDGAAITLLGEPEHALFAALTLRDGILKNNLSYPDDLLLVRIGVNLGPVRIVKDINDRLNVIGDGINVAQRVMSFAEPNQILVSRSYYEIVSRLSKDVIGMFSYSGIKQDKHVREHEVYLITPKNEATPFGDPSLIDSDNKPKKKKTVEDSAKKPAKFKQIHKVFVGASLSLLLALIGFDIYLDKSHQSAPAANNATTPLPAAPQASVQTPSVSPTAPVSSATLTPVVAPTAASIAAPAVAPEIAPAKPEIPAAVEKSVAVKQVAQKTKHTVAHTSDNNAPEESTDDDPPATENYGGGYLTKDASGQQVILYGEAADQARTRDKRH